MKSCLINPIGTSPMIVTELYKYLRNADASLKDVIIFHTKNKDVKRGSMAATASLLYHYDDVRVQLKELDSEDIQNSGELNSFLEIVVDSMLTERDKYRVDRFYLNATGGRKIQTIALSIFAGVLGISEVYNIVDRNIKNVNEYWEVTKSKTEEFDGCTDTEDLKSVYKKYEGEFDELFYPDPNVLNFMKVPVILMPEDERNILKKLIMGVNMDDEDFTISKLKAYQSSGLLTYDRSRTYATDLGNIILKYLR